MGSGVLLVKRKIKMNKYAGQYVASDAPENGNVVGHGTTPLKAVQMAEKNGCKTPYLMYVSGKDAVHIY